MRRWLVILLVLVLGCQTAGAQFSPGLSALGDAWQQGDVIGLEMSLSLNSLNAASPTSLSSLRSWLEGLSLKLNLAATGWDAALSRGNSSLFHMAEREVGQRSLLSLPEQGLAWWVDAGEPAAQLLADSSWTAWLGASPGQAMDSLWGSLDDIWPLLGKAPKATRAVSNIRYVGRSTQRVVYSLPAEAWQNLWPSLQPLLAEPLSLALPDAELTALQPLLSSLRFEGRGRLTRYLDAQGQDLGLQFAGKLAADGLASRQVTILAAYKAGQGLQFRLKAPALKGNDHLNALLGYALSEGKEGRLLEADLDCSWRQGEERGSWKGNLALKSLVEGPEEQLTGSLWLEAGPSSQDRQKRRITLSPSLRFDQAGGQGEVSIWQERGRNKPWALSLGLSVAPAQPLPALVPQEAVAMASPQALGQAQQALTGALRPVILDLFRHTNPADRQMLLHDLSGQWLARADSQPGLMLPLPDGTNFVVTDESAKEDTP